MPKRVKRPLYAQYIVICGAVICTYLVYVRTQRFKYQRMHQQIAVDEGETVSARSYHTIFTNIFCREFPFIATKSLEYALFKNYGIPSISSLLCKTEQFAPENIPKRYEDTDFILREYIENGLHTERGEIALKRLNYIHGQYSITNDDYLYTLSVFVSAPITFINRYGYRQLLEIEKEAIYEVMTSMGVAMKIKHIPTEYQQMIIFGDTYESNRMRYHRNNQALAVSAQDLLLSNYPRFMRNTLKPIVHCLMAERLRNAMGFDQPAAIWYGIVECISAIQKLFVGYLCLPRTQDRRRTPLQMCPVRQKYMPMYHEYAPDLYANGYRTEYLGPEKINGGQLAALGLSGQDTFQNYSS